MNTQILNQYRERESQQVIPWQDPRLVYCGRMDEDREDGILWVYPCSYVKVRFTGGTLRALVTNIRSYWNSSLGWLTDGEEHRGDLAPEGVTCLTLAEGLPEGGHEICLFKRMDSCHMVLFHGFLLEGGELLEPLPQSGRRMEVYGDSVSAGEVSEAVDYCGQPDPEHNGEFSNSYYSYAWLTARRLGAQLHDIAQGGVALLNRTGYFNDPHALGMTWLYDKIQYQPALCRPKLWDFSRYVPQVVVVAIGQNDHHPEDYMAQDYEGEKARYWRERYGEFLRQLLAIYPKAHIVCKTTILEHDPSWDRAIEETVRELGQERVHYFAYSNNSVGTKGHIRRPEAEQMARELGDFIEAQNSRYHFW